MMEYALIAIVIGLTALILVARYSGTLGGRYTSATRQVENTHTGSEELSAPGESGDGSQPPEDQPVAAKPLLTTDANGNTRVDVGVAKFDLTTVIWLGIAVVVLAAVMVVRIFKAGKQGRKSQVSE